MVELVGWRDGMGAEEVGSRSICPRCTASPAHTHRNRIKDFRKHFHSPPFSYSREKRTPGGKEGKEEVVEAHEET
ncbi:hypothetical protein ZHAS_00007700 [Anopheles sinensis]|uniref:Uncharacterized protein n=1 Tax=Anopheles sinensis TaxID=74873 RepID=A0A084VQB7_ANOSI|nr:hypothetical protein ZHAS_00007700 [Anopheles sinensis]